jgi:hypothetical protein
MTTKLLTFFDVARLGAPTGARVGAYSRARAERFLSAPNIRFVPYLRAPLECRWRIDPLTGTLSAIWLDPSAHTGTKSVSKSEIIDVRRCFRQSCHAALGRTVRSHVAARRAA